MGLRGPSVPEGLPGREATAGKGKLTGREQGRENTLGLVEGPRWSFRKVHVAENKGLCGRGRCEED